ncbi:MAG: hypothetical protein AMJ54_14755 [Deltaproteobacteria bacterium SG8_13]|nr:MAG: hypothetical protein AMJ54_14755 [Deltaproteobacteria bacterium SG8_13]
MKDFDNCKAELLKLREAVPRLIALLQISEQAAGGHWKNLDARLLPLLNPSLPLMVAVCGGANSGKSTFFNSFLGVELSPVRGDAGSTRRVLAAARPSVFDDENMVRNLFEPFGRMPEPLAAPDQLEEPGPPLYAAHRSVPPEQVLMDTPDFDTGSSDRYINRHIAREVLESCNVLIYIVTNATYNNLDNTRFMRSILTETGMRRCILVYNCSRTLTDGQVLEHLHTTAANLYGEKGQAYLLGFYRTDVSDAVASGRQPMRLRPVRTGDPPIAELLGQLDPRRIREKQIQSTLAAFLRYVRQVAEAARVEKDSLTLYEGALRLCLSYAVRQSLTSLPLEKIMRRIDRIWLETSPAYLRIFRGIGAVIGKPARMILSLAESIAGDAKPGARPGKPIDPLEVLTSDLLQSAGELRSRILADELVAETTGQDENGGKLVALLDRIRSELAPGGSRLPFRQAGSHPGSIAMHVGAPPASAAGRRQLEDSDWQPAAGRIAAAAENILNFSGDQQLNRELAELVTEFRRQMSFTQKTRESLFASLSILPATLGIAYVLTTGDPVGGSGIYAKLHGLFGMHDLWALVSIPATAGMDENTRRNLSDMLAPVVSRWFESRAAIVAALFEEQIAGRLLEMLQQLCASADREIEAVETTLMALQAVDRS